MIFRTAEPSLKEVLDDIANGKMQLPDFQRDWLWEDDNIKSLIASVSLSYPRHSAPPPIMIKYLHQNHTQLTHY